jgi:hypothetical protein
MRQVSLRKTPPNTPPPAPAAPPVTAKIRWRDEWTQLRTLLRRTFLSKLRNRGNIVLTALVPPLLALLVGWALYFTDNASGEYDFASAFHIPTYIFIALLVALFLALMNSVDDIIRDRVLLNRERNLDVRLPYYILSKFSTLTLFTAIQCALFVLVGNHILEIRGMFWPYFFFMVITAASGTCLGLVISSIVSDSKTAANFVPLVLIPQLIFGGALIKYEEMNRDLDLKYTFSSWFKRHPEIPSKNRDDSALAVPMISRLLATHYSYEALIVAQYKLNPLSQRQDQLLEKIDAIAAIAKQKSLTPAETTRMEDLKETLALLSGLVCRSAREVEKRLRGVDKILDGKPLDASDLRSRSTGISVDQIYTNQKVSDLVSKAEGEQNDYRRQTQRKRVHVNVFFGPEKRYVGITMSVFSWNSAILVGSSAGLLGLLYLILKRQLRPHGL